MRESNQRSFASASQYSITFNFDNVKLTNTFDAHRLIHFANTLGKQIEMKTALMKAYFTDGLNVSDHKVLIEIAKEIGLDSKEVSEMLDSVAFSSEVATDIAQAKELGITGVPMFVIDMNYAVSGAQGIDAILFALNKAWES